MNLRLQSFKSNLDIKIIWQVVCREGSITSVNNSNWLNVLNIMQFSGLFSYLRRHNNAFMHSVHCKKFLRFCNKLKKIPWYKYFIFWPSLEIYTGCPKKRIVLEIVALTHFIHIFCQQIIKRVTITNYTEIIQSENFLVRKL